MKKLLLIFVLFLFSVMAFSQVKAEYGISVGRGSNVPLITKVTKNAKNQYTVYVGQTILEPVIVDTITLQLAISLLPYVNMPSLTTTEITALTGLSEGIFVYDRTAHVLKFWNGGAWKTITTN